MAVADPVPVIQATLAPMFLVGGVAFFMWWVQERLFRVTDRVGRIRKVMRGLPAEAEGMTNLQELQDVLLRRAIGLRNATTFGVITLVLTALTAVLIIAPALMARPVPSSLTVSVFAAGLVSFVVSIVFGLRDTVMSVGHIAEEIAADPFVQG